MVYANSDSLRHPDLGGAQAVKILIAGGFGAGKTTLVSAISEIKPLRTEERLSQIGASIDDLTGIDGKTTTTVALDFGRITISSEVVLYLFGTPGQDRFWFMWKELSAGALGAVVLADTRRITDCFGSLDSSRPAAFPLSSRSTASTAPRSTPRTRSATPSTSALASPSSSAMPASAAQASRS